MYKVQTISVRDNHPRGFLTDDGPQGGRSDLFTSIDDVQRRVPRLLRGLSSTWQVRVVRADDTDTVVRLGFRAGPGGTGERWTWRDA
jgi:hypothetical protein